MSFEFHNSCEVLVKASAEELFDFLDDPRNLSSHMSESSVMMAGSKMNIHLDQKDGRGVGAEIILDGKMMGFSLFVREFVTASERPRKKIWSTSGPQEMIVIDQYEMGFELGKAPQGTMLTVFINFDLPTRGGARLLGLLFGHLYAKWCVSRMATDASNHFQSAVSGPRV